MNYVMQPFVGGPIYTDRKLTIDFRNPKHQGTQIRQADQIDPKIDLDRRGMIILRPEHEVERDENGKIVAIHFH